MPHHILYYTSADDGALMQQVDRELGWQDELEIHPLVHPIYSMPTEEDLRGMEAVIGQFMPCRDEEPALMRRMGVRLAASMSIGMNHFDLAALEREGVVATNCPGYCAEDVALHAFSLMLDLMRRVTFSNREVRSGVWEPQGGYTMHRPDGQTLGLVFFGHIARRLAPMAQSIGMRVLVWAPTKTEEELEAAGCQKAQTLDELLAASDVVSLHCPLIPQTERLIGAHELAVMKPTAFLVNTARGGVVDEDALADALDQGQIMAAALDVMDNEGDGTAQLNQRLINHERCLVTPHAAFVSAEALRTQMRMTLTACHQLLVEGRTPDHVCLP